MAISIISEIVKANKNWREWFATYYPDILVSEDNGYALFKYGINSNFNIPIVREARGIIIDTETGDVVCRACDKFGKPDDYYVDLNEFDWKSATTTDKLDGSMVKLWWSERDGRWVWSTMGTIYASKAPLKDGDENHKTFMDIINEANPDKIINQLCDADKDLTFIFELTSPWNQVVIQYNTTILWHLGTRNNKTQEEVEYRFSSKEVGYPGKYYCRSLEDAQKIASRFNRKFGIHVIDSCNNEGLVVRDKYYHRIKVKSDAYMMLHNVTSKTSKRYIIESIIDNAFDISRIAKLKNGHVICYYFNEYIQFMNVMKNLVSRAKWLYDQCESKKEFALLIKDYKYKHFMFKAVSIENATVEKVLADGKINDPVKNTIVNLCSAIPDYDDTEYSKSAIFKVPAEFFERRKKND